MLNFRAASKKLSSWYWYRINWISLYNAMCIFIIYLCIILCSVAVTHSNYFELVIPQPPHLLLHLYAQRLMTKSRLSTSSDASIMQCSEKLARICHQNYCKTARRKKMWNNQRKYTKSTAPT